MTNELRGRYRSRSIPHPMASSAPGAVKVAVWRAVCRVPAGSAGFQELKSEQEAPVLPFFPRDLGTVD